jgi:rhodanese-related sulfurtransferase
MKKLWLALALVVVVVAAAGITFAVLQRSSASGATASGRTASGAPDANGVANDSVAAVKNLIDHGALVLDVRTDAEWNAGRLAGSVHIPLAQVQARHAELPMNRTIVAVCHEGGRSYKAAFALRQLGYNVVNLAGGLKAWVAAGLPVVDASGAPDGRIV